MSQLIVSADSENQSGFHRFSHPRALGVKLCLVRSSTVHRGQRASDRPRLITSFAFSPISTSLRITSS
jgi:hypothetical protein